MLNESLTPLFISCLDGRLSTFTSFKEACVYMPVFLQTLVVVKISSDGAKIIQPCARPLPPWTYGDCFRYKSSLSCSWCYILSYLIEPTCTELRGRPIAGYPMEYNTQDTTISLTFLLVQLDNWNLGTTPQCCPCGDGGIISSFNSDTFYRMKRPCQTILVFSGSHFRAYVSWTRIWSFAAHGRLRGSWSYFYRRSWIFTFP